MTSSFTLVAWISRLSSFKFDQIRNKMKNRNSNSTLVVFSVVLCTLYRSRHRSSFVQLTDSVSDDKPGNRAFHLGTSHTLRGGVYRLTPSRSSVIESNSKSLIIYSIDCPYHFSMFRNNLSGCRCLIRDWQHVVIVTIETELPKVYDSYFLMPVELFGSDGT